MASQLEMRHITEKLISGEIGPVGYRELDFIGANIFDDSEVVYRIRLAVSSV
jgi:hypothetical protein